MAGLSVSVAYSRKLYIETRSNNERSKQISQAFVDFFTLGDEQGATDFDKSLSNLATAIAVNQANSVTASIRGQQSRALKATEEGFEEVAFAENPQAAMLLKALPAKIQKNKVAEMGMRLFLKKALSGGWNGSGSPGGSGDHPVRKHRD